MSVSEEFWDAIVNAGTLVQECGFCGKTHFADSGDFEPEELEDLRKNAAANPEKYEEHCDCDAIHFGVFAGRSIVFNCCEKELEKYENLIWSNRYIISKYFKARAKKELEAAQLQSEMIEGV